MLRSSVTGPVTKFLFCPIESFPALLDSFADGFVLTSMRFLVLMAAIEYDFAVIAPKKTFFLPIDLTTKGASARSPD